MLKVGQGLTLQRSPIHPGLGSKFFPGHQVLNLTKVHHQLDPLLWNLHPSLKISNCQEYLEAGLSGSMSNSNLIYSDLSASGPSNLYIFFTLKTKGMGVFLRTEGYKAAEDLENLLILIVWMAFSQQKCDHNALCSEDNLNLWFLSILDDF
jgi:hypothetical protein